MCCCFSFLHSNKFNRLTMWQTKVFFSVLMILILYCQTNAPPVLVIFLLYDPRRLFSQKKPVHDIRQLLRQLIIAPCVSNSIHAPTNKRCTAWDTYKHSLSSYCCANENAIYLQYTINIIPNNTGHDGAK